jgi:hypothetical protein
MHARDLWSRPVVLAVLALLCMAAPEASSRPLPVATHGGPTDREPAALSAAAESWPLDVRLEFRAAAFGIGIGYAGLQAVDLEGDGTVEIVATAFGGGFSGSRIWYVVSHGATGYRQTWISDPLPADIGSMAVANLDADAAREVLLAVGSEVRVYDGATRELQWTIPTAVSPILSLQVADVDSDGAQEIVFCHTSGLYVYDAHTGAAEVTGISEGCSSVGVGNVDGDSALEMVTGNGRSTGYVIDGVTRAPEWAYPLGFGRIVRLGDLDGDNIQEIVGAHDWQQISVLDAVSKAEEDAIYPSHDVGALEVADVEGDGPLEVLYGDGQWGSIHVLAGATLAEKWAVANPEHGVGNIVVGDTDADGVRELVWGAGFSSSGPDHLYVADSLTHEREWESLDFNGPFYGLAHGDVDGNGEPDFVFTSFTSDSGYGDGLFFVYDATDKGLRYVSPPPTDQNWTGLVRIQLANVDSDPQLEVLVGTGVLYRGVLICYDGLTHVEQWRAQVDDGLSIWSLQVGDVDGDGRLEAVMGTAREHTGAPGVFVYVIDAATGFREWRSPNLEVGWGALSLLRVAQVDRDPAPEILVAQYGGRLLVIDGVTHALAQLVDDGVTALETADPRGNGRTRIFIGTATGRVYELNRAGRLPARALGRFGGPIDGLAVRDFNGDGAVDYAFAVAGRLSIYDAFHRRMLWQSPVLGTDVATNDSLLVADIDEDGRQELMVNTGRLAVDIYEVPAAP